MKKSPNLHLEIQRSKSKSPVGILRSTYREGNKIRHQQFGRIIGQDLNQLRLLQASFRGQTVMSNSAEAFRIVGSKEYGASAAVLKMMRQLELDKLLYSKAEPWVDAAMAMIAGRLIFAGSKLSLCNEHRNSSLWDLSIGSAPDVDRHCYQALDKLLNRQKSIQKALAKRHLSKNYVVLYDITSSYLEGEYEDSELVAFGYNRDGKKSHEQIVIGLICNEEGCPIAVEVYPGNTKDETTVKAKIEELQKTYGIEQIIFVGDRGMVTAAQRTHFESVEALQTITALRRAEVLSLLERKVIQLDFFDAKNICEVLDPEHPKVRYCLCMNPVLKLQDQETRKRLLLLTTNGLEAVAHYKRATTPEILGARIGRLLQKYKMGAYFHWEIKANTAAHTSCKHEVIWKLDEAKLTKASALDGCYIIRTDTPAISKEAVVASYRKLRLVEMAFRQLKTVQLEIRPVYHQKDDRIRAHVFLCMLAYYVQWHIQERLSTLFAQDGKGKHREWTLSNVLHTLQQITRNRVRVSGVEFERDSELTQEQKKIVSLLGIDL